VLCLGRRYFSLHVTLKLFHIFVDIVRNHVQIIFHKQEGFIERGTARGPHGTLHISVSVFRRGGSCQVEKIFSCRKSLVLSACDGPLPMSCSWLEVSSREFSSGEVEVSRWLQQVIRGKSSAKKRRHHLAFNLNQPS
jgi:hypothetical protein